MDGLNIPPLASEPLPIQYCCIACMSFGNTLGGRKAMAEEVEKEKRKGKRLIVSQSLPGHDAACLLSELPSPLSHSEKNRRKKNDFLLQQQQALAKSASCKAEAPWCCWWPRRLL